MELSGRGQGAQGRSGSNLRGATGEPQGQTLAFVFFELELFEN